MESASLSMNPTNVLAAVAIKENEALSGESVKEASPAQSSEAKANETDISYILGFVKLEIKTRVNAMWEQMNKGVSKETLRGFSSRPRAGTKTNLQTSNNWKAYLGLGSKKTETLSVNTSQERSKVLQSSTTEEAKRLAAAALSAVKDATVSTSGRGRVEISEIRDFAGQEIEVRKFVDANSKEAAERSKASAPSAVDAVLEQIKKKAKLSVLDKTKKDWGEFKEENKGMEEELDAYKKSSNQYLEKVSFLQRTDYREFERERDARLAVHARRKPDMRDEP